MLVAGSKDHRAKQPGLIHHGDDLGRPPAAGDPGSLLRAQGGGTRVAWTKAWLRTIE
jgi:hypothetical protein